ncbi:MAG: cob(I)yrinic acid a,c-diamide adenosyltransferase [Desulfovibrionaceae bacterium]|nr:cob(I)yrinic acid a,c-diamide adenosyltransferase [Desulfovibrionaceae bacterium]
MILVYTGNGKGKTSACVGQVMRAVGAGLRVAFVQFMKKEGMAGEQLVLYQLLGEKFRAGGRGFLRTEEDRPQHREAALNTLHWAFETLPHVDMLVLDELLYALGAGVLLPEEVRGIVDKARNCNVHLVLSGRGLPGWLEEEADLITEMEERKHPWQQGHGAVRGIEF